MGTGMTTIVDDSDPAIIYSNGWTQIGTLTSQSTEYNATCHRADQNGLTAQYTFYGRRITIAGTLESPGTYGYPSVTYTLDNGNPNTVDLTQLSEYVNPTGVTPHMTLYQSEWADNGFHTLKWTVNNVSPSGAKVCMDAFLIEGPQLLSPSPSSSSSKDYYVAVDDADGDISWAGDWQQGGFTGEYIGTDRTPSASGASLTYTFTGTGITAYGTIYGNQSPSPQIDIQLDSSHLSSYTAPTVSQTTVAVVLYQVAGLSQGQHQITLTSASSSLWSFDYFLYQPFGGPNPSFYLVPSSILSSGTSGSDGGSISNATSTVNPTGTTSNSTHASNSSSTGAQQSVFVSYSLSNGIPVPAKTYTMMPGDTDGTGGVSQLTDTAWQGGLSSVSIGVIIGVVLASLAAVALILFLVWWVLHRRRIRQSTFRDDATRKEDRGRDIESVTVDSSSANMESLPTKTSEKGRLARRYGLTPDVLSNYRPPSEPSELGVITTTSPRNSDEVNDRRISRPTSPSPSASTSTSSLVVVPLSIPIPTPIPTNIPVSMSVSTTEARPRERQRSRQRERARARRIVVIRELDGGVRIASGADGDDGPDEHGEYGGSDSRGRLVMEVQMEILPPSYELHHSNR